MTEKFAATVRRRWLLATAVSSAVALSGSAASAQSRAETLRYVTGGVVNTLDPTMPGSTREAFGLSMSTYDRLVAFDRKQIDGKWVFDFGHIRGELAESYEFSPDRLKIIFHLRSDAKFQDRTPVTAEDVKWSLDRAVTANSLSKAQFLTGSISSPDQFKVLDSHTIEVTLPKPDKLALPNFATVFSVIYNSKLAKAHATAEDPWAQRWLKDNLAGSGAYSVESVKSGEQLIAKRNDNWNRGPSGRGAFFRRLIIQTVPEAATRANLVERGDADIVIDLQPTDAAALEAKGKLKIISTPEYNAVTFISFNNRIPPFDNVNVRKAIAYALPYEAMFKAALFDRGRPLFGAAWPDGKATTGAYPFPQPVTTDLAKARKFLEAAGMPNGFSTTFSFNVGQSTTAEPMAALLRESLGKIGINVEIQKLPDAQMSTLINDKKVPFFTDGIVAYLPSTDYFYRNFYMGNIRWNYSSLDDSVINEIAQAARFEPDSAKYEEMGRELNTRHFELMPQVLLWQPAQDAVMAPSIEGYTYQFHRQVDFRDLSRK